MKDGVKLDLQSILTNSGQQQPSSQQQQQSSSLSSTSQLQISTQVQYNNNSPPPSSTSSSSASSTPRIVIINRDLHFEKINHKVSSLGQNRVSDEGEYRCIIKTNIGLVLGPVVTLQVASGKLEIFS